VLATEEVRWINAVNTAREQRLRSEVEGAARRFSEDIDRELLSVVSVFEVRRPAEIAERFQAWKLTARDPKLVSSVRAVSDESLRFGFDTDALRLVMPIGGERSGEFLVVQFDAADLTQRVFPDAARRYFDDFDVAVSHGNAIAYRSSSSWPESLQNANPDLVWSLLLTKHRVEEHGIREAQSSWRLLVRHHGEAISELVAHGRRHDLAFAMAILSLLAASLVVLAAATRRAERLRRQQIEFVAGVTHELHTPLAALASAGQNLADSVPVDTVRYGETIVKETHRLIDLVDQVLQFGGIEAGAVPRREEIVDTRATIDEAIAGERGVRIDSSGDGAPAIRGDRAAVTRAVQNLVANAIRHGGAGGWVGVSAGAENGFVVIRVEDRGSGIAAADLPHLFEPFYRGRNAQTRGSGLGLTIVDRVARSHGGSISVTMGREHGAEFVLRLPRAE